MINIVFFNANFAAVFGFIETPYRKVVKGRVTDQVDYLTADEEDEHIIAQANAPLTDDNHFAETRVLVRRRGGEVEYIHGDEVDYMDVSPRQMVSVATTSPASTAARNSMPVPISGASARINGTD